MLKLRRLLYLMTFFLVTIFMTLNVSAADTFPYTGLFTTTDKSALIHQIEVQENEV